MFVSPSSRLRELAQKLMADQPQPGSSPLFIDQLSTTDIVKWEEISRLSKERRLRKAAEKTEFEQVRPKRNLGEFEMASPLRRDDSELAKKEKMLLCKVHSNGKLTMRIPKKAKIVDPLELLEEARKSFAETGSVPVLEDFMETYHISRRCAKVVLSQFLRENSLDLSFLLKRKKCESGSDNDCLRDEPPPLAARTSYYHSKKKLNSRDETAEYQLGSKFQNAALSILWELRQEDSEGLFRAPPHLNYVLRSKPMSLDIMRGKVLKMEYTRIAGDFKADFSLMMSNWIKNKSCTSKVQSFREFGLKLIYKWEKVLMMGSVSEFEAPQKPETVDRTELWRKDRVIKYTRDFQPDSLHYSLGDYHFHNPFPYEETVRYLIKTKSKRSRLDVLRKLATKKKLKCDGNHCDRLQALGPYDMNSEQWLSSAVDRKNRVECSSECGCDPMTCRNQGIGRGRRKRLSQVREAPTFGISQHTRQAIKDVLLNDKLKNKDEEVEAYITNGLLVQFNWFLDDQRQYPIMRSARRVYKDTAIMGDNAPFFFTDILRMIILKCKYSKLDLLKVDPTDLMSMSKALYDFVKIDASANFIEIKEGELPKGGDSTDLHSDCIFPIFSKGNGVICIDRKGIDPNEFIVEYFGEVYPAWRWAERCELIKRLEGEFREGVKVPEFYNIMLERHRDDPTGYDLVYVDPHRKGNFASRLSHSCTPNCATVVMAVRGTYFIGLYALKRLEYGEELTFDYNSLTEKMEEYKDAVCLCGTTNCRGTYLYFRGSNGFQHIITRDHNFLRRTAIMVNATLEEVTQVDLEILRKYNLKESLLDGLPSWCEKWAASILEFVEHERRILPQELIHQDGFLEADAIVETGGVESSRIQNMALTLNKMRYFLRMQELDVVPPPVRLADPEVTLEVIWNGERSILRELLNCLEQRCIVLPHDCDFVNDQLPETEAGIQQCQRQLRHLRDRLKFLSGSNDSCLDAAADILHLYSNTKHFFVLGEYREFKSEPFTFADLGLVNLNHKLAACVTCKCYEKSFIWSMQAYWDQQADDPLSDAMLLNARRGSVQLPNIASCFSGLKYDREVLVHHLKTTPWQSWPDSLPFTFSSTLFGTPYCDLYIENNTTVPNGIDYLNVDTLSLG